LTGKKSEMGDVVLDAHLQMRSTAIYWLIGGLQSAIREENDQPRNAGIAASAAMLKTIAKMNARCTVSDFRAAKLQASTPQRHDV